MSTSVYDYSVADALFAQLFGSRPNKEFTVWDDCREGFRACYRLLRPENVDYEFKELGHRLHTRGESEEEMYALCGQAADAIRLQAERIAELGIECHDLTEEVAHYSVLLSQEAEKTYALQAKLSRWELQQWQPIKTAPKDGTRILIGGWWSVGVAGFENGAWYFMNDCHVLESEPTCWQHIVYPNGYCAASARLPDDEGEK